MRRAFAVHSSLTGHTSWMHNLRRSEHTDDPSDLTQLETVLAILFALVGIALLAFLIWYFFCRVPEPRQTITKYETRVEHVQTPVPMPMMQAPIMQAPIMQQAPVMQMQAPVQMMGTVQAPIMGGFIH
jgi:hypothetical protein